jgi:SAM-dependent methyltransferase
MKFELDKEEEQSLFLSLRDKEAKSFKDFFLKDKTDDSVWRVEDYSKCLSDITRDWVYIYQDRKAFEILSKMKETANTDIEILDVGSMFYAALYFATIGRTLYLEPRLSDMSSTNPIMFPSLNLGFIQGEAQSIPAPDSAFDVITCLHALEHFGLGRYGDTIDYYGDQKGLSEFNRVLKNRGGLILSVPVSENPRIEFNTQRVYSPDIIDEMLDDAGFNIVSRMYIVSLGLHRNESGDVLEPITSDRQVLQNVDDSQQAAYMTVAIKE